MPVQFRDTKISLNAPSAQRASTIMTSWGYIVRSRDILGRRAVMIERVCLLAGAMLVIPGAWHWALPMATGGQVSSHQHILLAVSVIIAGLLFLWIANRGLREEIHVDRANRQLRVMSVNRLGRTRVKTSIDFDAIDQAFSKGAKDGTAELCLRLTNLDEVLVTRTEPKLSSIMTNRLTQDFGQDQVPAGHWRKVG